MKIKATFELDLESGEFKATYENVSKSGGLIDLTKTMEMLRAVLNSNEEQAIADTAN